MFEATNKKISQKTDKEVARIREMEQKLKQEAKEIYQDRVKTLQTADDANNAELTVAEQILNEMNYFLAQKVKIETLFLKKKWLHSFRELTEQQPQIVPYKLQFMDFQESGSTEMILGKLILKDERRLVEPNLKPKSEWTLEVKMKLLGKHAITSVAVFSNNEIVTADYGLKKLVTYLPTSNPESPFTSKILAIQAINEPHKVAVNRLDHLIVLDGRVVKTFSREYQLLHQFQPGTDSDTKPTCLAVDEDNLIAVGYKAKGEISLHNPDGTLIRRLPAPMIEDHLAISRKQIIYSNNSKGKLISRNYHSGTKFIVDTQYPKSVCCDRQGNIYVAKVSRFMSRAGDINSFDAHGKHIGQVTKDCKLTVGMTFTSTGDLVVGRLGWLQIYHPSLENDSAYEPKISAGKMYTI
ncbi:uncharacterized protein LOC110976966 [Acanthaster planci]|uniref:Uncharacterized protein LOC110976966 n=1 Tax=Acanthaster planci TaxID=133434 RepID=A0A8B7Y1K1_ACAPL|nr:uncharacterized protein LOC110976966 [Acanthaster planci]